VRERDARHLLILLLLCAVPPTALRALGRTPVLGPPGPALPCAVPVEAAGAGVACLTVAPPGLHAGDRLAAQPWAARMAPARLAAFAAPIDLNRASRAELASLDGIGPKLAERIARARPFASVEELAQVRGIGARRLAHLRVRLIVTPTFSGDETREPEHTSHRRD
jgi:hypothetical protein